MVTRPGTVGHALILLRKDLATEWRTRVRLSPMVFFVLLVMLVFNFGFEARRRRLVGNRPRRAVVELRVRQPLRTTAHLRQARPATTVLRRSSPLRCPGDPSTWPKWAETRCSCLACSWLTLPLFGLFFNLTPGFYLLPLTIVFVLGSACVASVGTLFAAMAGHSRLRELLLPLLLLPILLPALISCVAATGAVLASSAPGRAAALWPPELTLHVAMLALFALVFTWLALILFDFIIEE